MHPVAPSVLCPYGKRCFVAHHHGRLGCLWFLTIVNAAVDIGVQGCVAVRAPGSWVCDSGSVPGTALFEQCTPRWVFLECPLALRNMLCK